MRLSTLERFNVKKELTREDTPFLHSEISIINLLVVITVTLHVVHLLREYELVPRLNQTYANY